MTVICNRCGSTESRNKERQFPVGLLTRVSEGSYGCREYFPLSSGQSYNRLEDIRWSTSLSGRRVKLADVE